MKNECYDKIIFGAGAYGLYAALYCGRLGQRVLVIERDKAPFQRASYINQARVHMGYHYPRSISTAKKSAGYFERFCEEYGFCVYRDFKQIYATSSTLSWTNAPDFRRFCDNAGIPCEKIDGERYFNPGMCDGAFLAKEYTYDAGMLRAYMIDNLKDLDNVKIIYDRYPYRIDRHNGIWEVKTQDETYAAPFILNATYASVNDVINIVDGGVFSPFKIKYELCEIILCETNGKMKDIGITVMDGLFFSIMPFGKTGLHSLTSVEFTPHDTSHEALVHFPCQFRSEKKCKPGNLKNCNECLEKPLSSWMYMSQLARKYMRKELEFTYYSSLYSMKPLLESSEMDDSRPTVIKKHCEDPTFVSVLSGKINTVYDLDEILLNE